MLVSSDHKAQEVKEMMKPGTHLTHKAEVQEACGYIRQEGDRLSEVNARVMVMAEGGEGLSSA